MARMKRNQLRKQPKRRRTYSSSAVKFPHADVSPTAKKRRRRQKTEGVRFRLVTLKRIVFSSRWISLGLLALTIFALVIIAQERRFYLTYLPVEGSVSFEDEEIIAASNLAGRHIFAANPSQAAADITAMPGVISSTVSLHWPNQVTIDITEEAPVAVWQENGLAYGITDRGRLIPVGFPMTGLLQIIPETDPAYKVVVEEDVASAEQEEVPAGQEEVPAEQEEAEVAAPAPDEAAVVEETTEENVEDTIANEGEAGNGDEAEESDSDISGPELSIAFVPQEVLVGALNLRELRPNINELYYRPSEGLSFQDGRGWRVHFGTGNDMNQKLVLYETVLDDLLTRGINPVYISVSNKDKPYYLAQ